MSILHVQIPSETGPRQISLWESSEGIRYLFLPSGCDLSDAVIRLDTSAAVYINGKQIQDGQSLEAFALGEEYTMETRQTSCSFQILQSANVATLYLDTASGSMKAIHADKSNSETVSVALYASDGTLDYHGTDATLKGRGNSTWQYEKKPYLLTIPEGSSLLGMGNGIKWVLLANALDETNLRNKLVFDMSSQLAFDWVPECQYVDLYLNGEYAGLYLLTERVEIGTERLDIADDPNSFLCKLEITERLPGMKNPFVTELGRAVEITSPVQITSAQKSAIQATVQQMEDVILSGGDLTGILDLDSWVRRFLVDEITENLDSERASSYFYYVDGLIHAGPVWDYDNIWGTRDLNLNPQVILATSPYKSSIRYFPYTNALYENPLFYERVLEIYEAEFLPVLTHMAQAGILEQSEQIRSATAMNALRWQDMFQKWGSRGMNAQDLAEFLSLRLEHLNSVWLDGQTYYSVQVEIDADLNYYNYAVAPGSFFDPIILAELTGLEDPTWVHAETGEIYDPAQPVTRDLRLNLNQETRASVDQAQKDSRLTLIYTGTLLAGILTAILLECNRNRKKRRRKHETVGR